MKSCISTYSFEGLYGEHFTRFDAIDRTKELGCDGVEFVLDDNPPQGYTPLSYAKALTDHAREIGLDVPIYTTAASLFTADPSDEIRRVQRHIDIAAECGIPLLRHDVAWNYYFGYEGVRSYRAVIRAVAPAIRELTVYAQSVGVRTCTENHGLLLQDSDRMLELFTEVDHPNYGFLCDIGNFGCVDEDCAAAVSKLRDLIVHVHAKDVFTKSGMSYDPGEGYSRSRAGNFRRATIFGHGNVPAYQILFAIRQSGYNQSVSLEFEGIEETAMAVRIGSENLRRMLRDIEQNFG